MRLFLVSSAILFFAAKFFTCHASEADDMREKGIAALKDSQTNQRVIVDAARSFVKASELYAAAGDDEKAIEMNSFLYWCKKKMTLDDIETFIKGGESLVSTKLEAIEKLAPKGDEAQSYLDRAEQFAAKNPTEHLLIAIRFFEVADRFKGAEQSFVAKDRSLKEQIAAQNNPSNPALSSKKGLADEPPRTRQPIPSVEKQKDAEKLIKDLFKTEYSKADPASRLQFFLKLMQQADENKADPLSEYVFLREARDLAIVAGESDAAVRAFSVMNTDFAINYEVLFVELV